MTSLTWLYLLFFLSGISGLMYEVVWVRMLTRILGSTVYATSTVLAAFMAGLALGSWLAGRHVDRVRLPLALYAALELGIGLSALTTLTLTDWMLPLYRVIYDFAGGARAWLTVGQVLIALLVLLLPTALMGATLPTLCAHGTRQHLAFSRCVGLLYALNTLGAVVGILASGFILLGAVGETMTLTIGVVLNVLVALMAAWLSRVTARIEAPISVTAGASDQTPALYPAGCRRMVVAAFALSGFVSLASEVVWSRMLLLYQGTSIYSFSSMLAVVLAGIGLGSFAGGCLVPRWRDPLRQLARLQLAVGLATVIALHLFPRLGPGLIWPALVLLGPLGLLWGLSFPVGAACYTNAEAGAGRNIGLLYAWNTIGCIAGSLSAGFILVPLLGSSRALACLAVISIVMGLLLLCLHPHGLRQRRAPEWGLLGACVLLLPLLGDPYFMALERRMLGTYPGGVDVHSHTEDAAAAVTVFSQAGGNSFAKQLWINGVGMTCLAPVTKLMAHLPIALADQPRDVLVICVGMGTSVRSAAMHEGVRVRAVDLFPTVPRAFGYFHPDVPDLLHSANVEVVVDDGRNYLLMQRQKFDVITLDPPPPLDAAGTVNLYSRDFFALCRDRLQPGGVLCVWIPPDRESENKMLFQSFLDVFEHTQVWSGPWPHTGFLMIGTLRPLSMAGVPARIRQLYSSPKVAADLRAWGDWLDEPDKILDLYFTTGDVLRDYCREAKVISDDHPYTEFPLWRRWNVDGEYHQYIHGKPYKMNPNAPNPYQ
jgi:spermidine synthase